MSFCFNSCTSGGLSKKRASIGDLLLSSTVTPLVTIELHRFWWTIPLTSLNEKLHVHLWKLTTTNHLPTPFHPTFHSTVSLPLAGSQCAGLFSASFPNLRDLTRAPRKKPSSLRNLSSQAGMSQTHTHIQGYNVPHPPVTRRPEESFHHKRPSLQFF